MNNHQLHDKPDDCLQPFPHTTRFTYQVECISEIYSSEQQECAFFTGLFFRFSAEQQTNMNNLSVSVFKFIRCLYQKGKLTLKITMKILINTTIKLYYCSEKLNETRF